jgi:exopolysaccharide production protein ExoZ
MVKLASIQILRAVAATSVVASHFQYVLQKQLGLGDTLPDLSIGGSGVDLFFIISGFVMVHASQPLFGMSRGPAIFLSHRLWRIVPLYWAVTSFYLAASLLLPALGGKYHSDFIVGSYLFLPTPGAGGVYQPIVGQGWTLNYEMFFYAIFSLMVWTQRSTAVLATVATLVALVLVGKTFAPLPGAIDFWTNPIILEFAFGMMIGMAYADGIRLPRSIGWLFSIAGLILLVSLAGIGERVIAWGLPLWLIFAGIVLGDFRPRGRLTSALSYLGDASYALYLTHSIPVLAVVLFMRWIKWDGGALVWFYALAAVSGAIVLAVLVHVGFERPVAMWAQRLKLPRPPGAQTEAPISSRR